MSFTTVPFNICGATYESSSRPLSTQSTMGFFQLYNENGKDPYTMHSFYGRELLTDAVQGDERGYNRMNEVLYRVCGTKLYEVSSAGVHTEKGSVSGSGRCILTNDGDNLVIVSDAVYIYTKSTNTFVINTNVNLTNVLSATFLNSKIIYTTSELSFVAAAEDPFDVEGVESVGADSSPDKMVRDYAFNQTLYRFGIRTCEPWYDAGTGTPPIFRYEGQQFSIGLKAIHSLAQTDNALYWLGDDNIIYRVSGSTREPVSDDGLANAIENMEDSTDAIGNTFTFQGQNFYMITFVSGNRTFVINEKLGVNGIFELSTGINEQYYSGTSIIDAYGKNYVLSRDSVSILNKNKYTQLDDLMVRRRITKAITSDVLGVKGKNMKMSRLEIIMEQGEGLITGQGEVPKMMIETSIDGGRSYAHSAWIDLGRLGENTLRVELFNILFGQSFVFRLTITDPVPVSIYSAAIDLKLAGK